MASIRGVPVFLSIALGVLLGLIVWSYNRVRARQARRARTDGWGEDMLVWLLVVAAFVGGAFVSYALLRP